MADTIPVSCPSCAKGMKVPVAMAGKKIRCKECQTVFAVPTVGGAKPAMAKPATAKPAPPKPAGDTFKLADAPKKPVAPKKPAAVPAPAPAAKKPPVDDDEDNDNPYGITANEFDIARCPFCAIELDPPDTAICLNCGYDMVQRRRHETKKIEAHTTGDYIKHHLPAAACVIAILIFIAVIYFSLTNMSDLFRQMDLEDETENEVTKKKNFVVPPGACSLPIIVGSLFVIWKAGQFAFKRFVYNWKPIEVVQKDK